MTTKEEKKSVATELPSLSLRKTVGGSGFVLEEVEISCSAYTFEEATKGFNILLEAQGKIKTKKKQDQPTNNGVG